MELKIFKDKEIKIDFDDVKTETNFKAEITESNFAEMIEKYKNEISSLVIKEEYFSKEILAIALLTKDFYYAAKKNELSLYRDKENASIKYCEKTACFSSDEIIDKGYVEEDMFHESDFSYICPLKTEDYEKYRRMFKIVDILIPEHYGAKYRMDESGTTVRLEKHFNTGEVWEILMTGSAAASGVLGYIDNLKIDEDKKTEHFSEKFIPKEFKEKKLRTDNVFMLKGNKGILDFKDDESLIEADYENVSFVMDTETNELIFPDEEEEKIEEAAKYFLSLIEKAKEYVREEDVENAERILRKNIRTEYSKMLEKLKDVNF